MNRTEQRYFAAMFAIAMAGAFFRLFRLNVLPGLNPDEVEVVMQWFRKPIVFWYISATGRPLLDPIGPILLWPFVKLASPAPWLVRVPAVISGIAALPVVFWFVYRKFGSSVAISSTILAAVSPLMISYSRIGWDPAYVPVLTALVIGFAFTQRGILGILSMILLFLSHPTGIFVGMMVMPLLFLQSQNNYVRFPRKFTHKVMLAVIFLVVCVGVIGALIMAAEQFTIDAANIFAIIISRLFSLRGIILFIGAYIQTIGGPWIYATFSGGPIAEATPIMVGFFFFCILFGGWIFWNKRKINEFTVLASFIFALFSEYLSFGLDGAAIYRERYLLWAVIPTCIIISLIIQAICDSFKQEKWGPFVVASIGTIWLISFYLGYMHPLLYEGGNSAVLDYRTSIREPKVMVLDFIRDHRKHPESAAVVFVGESRLELGLMYLASQDSELEIKNLGKVFYRYFQHDDRSDLLRIYNETAISPRDVFFVDYDWDYLSGPVRAIHKPAADSAGDAVAPWKTGDAVTVKTAGGRPLLKIWRLSRGQDVAPSIHMSPH